ncbi:hypothetical protein SAMN04488570_2619 [Nocardioides scoriae]|uniref:Uncharacterized protein n=1 Tax=Nocardioides scoriae TaxID=642780 RepID=A0A1H1UUJ5_9ACTN|nr:hypothetical protein SAMN04488570_2619 [Nocardioides scoriae]
MPTYVALLHQSPPPDLAAATNRNAEVVGELAARWS